MKPPAIFSLTSRVAAITGAGSGIGEAIALLFARQGARVLVLDLDEAAARRTAERIVATGGAASAIACDVSDAGSVGSAFGAIDRDHGRLDVLVNNAGIAHVGTAETTPEPDAGTEKQRAFSLAQFGGRLTASGEMQIDVSALDPLMFFQHLLPRVFNQVLNMASIASLVGIPDRFAYSMSKGAVLAMTRSIAVDYMKKGVRCNCVCPARVHTPFVDGYLATNYPGREREMFETLSAYQPLGRMGTPEEVAQLALYLCADESAFVTGQAFPLDGGVLVT